MIMTRKKLPTIQIDDEGTFTIEIAKDCYTQAVGRFDELCGPYASVIDINRAQLPTVEQVARWTGEQYAHALRHDQARAF